MHRVLITGGSGFVGTNLVDAFSDKGWHVVNIDIVAPRNPAHKKFWKMCDIRDFSKLEKITLDFNPHVILHMAARTDLDGRSLEEYSANILGVTNLINVAKKLSSLDRVVFASSMLVCRLGYKPIGNTDYCPDTIYGRSKVIGEQTVFKTSEGAFPWTIVRPTSLWGPWFATPYRNFFDYIQKKRYLHPRGKRIYRSYGYVQNTTFQIDKLLSFFEPDAVNGKVFYIADHQPIELFDWAGKIANSFNVGPIPEVPLTLLRFIAAGGDVSKYFGINHVPLTTRRLKNLLTDAVYDIAPLLTVTGPLPYHVDTATSNTVEWMLKNQSEAKK